MLGRFPEVLQRAASSKDIRHQQSSHWSPSGTYPSSLASNQRCERSYCEHTSPRRISSLLGIEGLHQIGNSASVLRMYHQLGVRYATLTHICHNAYADSEEPSQPLNNGLSPRGVKMVREMNRLGMMVDLSHTSAATQRDAIAVSEAPIVFTHSNAYSLCPHSRNVHDDVLRQVKHNGGIMMVTFYTAFANCKDASEASLDDVADHIMYIGLLIGFEHVGIGSDFDGMTVGPRGLEDVSKYPALVHELHARGLRGEALDNVLVFDIIRVLGEIEEASRKMQAGGVLPLEDDVKDMFEGRD